MTNIDAIAQRYPQNESRPLVDYLPVLLPCQVLIVDSLVIEQHPIPTPVEFVMKTIAAGLSTEEEIGLFLGLSSKYAKALIHSMKDDEFILGDGNNNLVILPRGRDVMQKGGDRKLKDRSISLLWDPISEQPIFGRPTLVSDYSRADYPSRIRFPSISKAPRLADIDISMVQSYRRFVKDVDIQDDKEDILRLVSLRRTIFRYRPATILLYENGQSPIAKIAIDNIIDEQLSSAFAQKDGIKYLGVDSAFSRKAGALAVEERFRKLAVKADGGSMRALSQQRGVLRLKIDTWNARLDEGPSTQISDQLALGVSELNRIDETLKSVPVRALNAPEMSLSLVDALTTATKSVFITTTTPSYDRFTIDIGQLMEAALRRGVEIAIYISDRPIDEPTSAKVAKSSLSRLNELARKYRGLSVFFLRQIPRPSFEIVWDGIELAFSNDPPLGLRNEPSVPRLFRGYRVSSQASVTDYVARNMNFSSDDLIKHLRVAKKDVKGERTLTKPQRLRKSPVN